MELKDKPLTNLQKTFALLLIFGIIFFLFGIIFYAYSKLPEFPIDFYEGNASVEFCTEKCDNLDYLASINNTKYGFILCECVSGVQLGDGKYSPTASISSVRYYFNSETLEEKNEKEVLDRINNEVQ